jgi:hypothetical protein
MTGRIKGKLLSSFNIYNNGLEKGLGLEKNDLEICLGLDREILNNVSNLK